MNTLDNNSVATSVAKKSVAKKSVVKVTKKPVVKVTKKPVAKVEKIEDVATIENVAIVIKPKALNSIQKSILMLTKVSGVDEKTIITFLAKNLANQKDKVKLANYITKLVLKIASGTLTIEQLENESTFNKFVEQIANQFSIDKNKLQNFVLNQLASKKKISLEVYFKDLFFKASTNPEFLAKIQDFKRF